MIIKRAIQGIHLSAARLDANKIALDLINVDIIDGEEQVYSTYYCVIPYGYPVPTLHRDSELHKYQNAFENCQIFSRGRFGQWKYGNRFLRTIYQLKEKLKSLCFEKQIVVRFCRHN
jgi:hypothetical protein